MARITLYLFSLFFIVTTVFASSVSAAGCAYPVSTYVRVHNNTIQTLLIESHNVTYGYNKVYISGGIATNCPGGVIACIPSGEVAQFQMCAKPAFKSSKQKTAGSISLQGQRDNQSYTIQYSSWESSGPLSDQPTGKTFLNGQECKGKATFWGNMKYTCSASSSG